MQEACHRFHTNTLLNKNNSYKSLVKEVTLNLQEQLLIKNICIEQNYETSKGKWNVFCILRGKTLNRKCPCMVLDVELCKQRYLCRCEKQVQKKRKLCINMTMYQNYYLLCFRGCYQEDERDIYKPLIQLQKTNTGDLKFEVGLGNWVRPCI